MLAGLTPETILQLYRLNRVLMVLQVRMVLHELNRSSRNMQLEFSNTKPHNKHILLWLLCQPQLL